MAHLLLYGLLAVILAAGLFGLAARFLPAGEQIAPSVRDEPPWELPPDRELQPEDVDSVRLPVALRGYRFAETDTLLDRLATELRARDDEIARLRGHAPVAEGPPDGPAAETGAAEVGAPTPYSPPTVTAPPPWAVAPSTPWSNPPPWAVTAPPTAAQGPAAEAPPVEATAAGAPTAGAPAAEATAAEAPTAEAPAAEAPTAEAPTRPEPPDDERS